MEVCGLHLGKTAGTFEHRIANQSSGRIEQKLIITEVLSHRRGLLFQALKDTISAETCLFWLLKEILIKPSQK